MKIPESVRIGGVEYRILRAEPSLNDGIHMLCGQIDYQKSLIRLSDEVKGREQECITLWHEILHGIRNHAGVQIEDEETAVEMFAKGIYQVLADNGGRLFDIAEPKRCSGDASSGT